MTLAFLKNNFRLSLFSKKYDANISLKVISWELQDSKVLFIRNFFWGSMILPKISTERCQNSFSNLLFEKIGKKVLADVHF